LYVFSISDNDLKNLTPERAVDFFRRLLWAEAARTGVSLNLIDVPQCINVGDGGLDAFVENAIPTFQLYWLKTFLQIQEFQLVTFWLLVTTPFLTA